MSNSQIFWSIIGATGFLATALWGLTQLSKWCDKQMEERMKGSPWHNKEDEQ